MRGKELDATSTNYYCNPNNIFRIVSVQGHSGCPIYTLMNVDGKNAPIEMNFNTIGDCRCFVKEYKVNTVES
jgi:hypothetical protein